MRRFVLVFLMISLLSLGLKYIVYGEVSKPRFWWPYFSDDDVTLRTLDLYLESLVEDYSNAQSINEYPETFLYRLVENVRIDFSSKPQLNMNVRSGGSAYRWSNGKKLTAQDIVFTINDILKSGKFTTVFTYIAETIKSISYGVGGKLEVNFYFPSRYILSAMEFYVLPHWIRTASNYQSYMYRGWDSLVCSGPYVPVYETENRVYFAANRMYPFPPDIDYVVMDVTSDPKTMVEKFTNGDLDIIMPLETRETSTGMEALRRDPRVLPIDSIENRFYYIAFNYDNPFFRISKVRRLMMETIDRRKLLRDIFSNRGTIITGPFLPDFPGVDARIQPIPYKKSSVPKLKSLVEFWKPRSVVRGETKETKEARARGGLVLIYPQDPNFQKLTKLVSDYWKKAGLKVTPIGLEPSAYSNALRNGDFDLALVEYSAMRSFTSVRPLLAPNGSQNYGRYNSRKNGSYDSTLTRLLNWVEGANAFSMSDQDRINTYRKIHRYVHDKVVHIWLFALQRTAFVWKYKVSIPYLVPERPFKNIDMWEVEVDRENPDIEKVLQKVGW